MTHVLAAVSRLPLRSCLSLVAARALRGRSVAAGGVVSAAVVVMVMVMVLNSAYTGPPYLATSSRE